MKHEYFLFFLYISGIFWLLPKAAFIKKTGLGVIEIRLLLAFKILTGLVGAYYFTHIMIGEDYFVNNEEGIIQYNLLLKNPGLFFTDYKSDLNKYGAGGLLNASDSFWGYFRFYILYKYLAFQNLITNGNFYLNAAVFSSVIFWGHLAFYRLFHSIYKTNKYPILIVCFLLPSILLFTSVQHKDGIVFLCIAFASLSFLNILYADKIRVKNAGIFLIALIGIFLLRNFILFAILPAMTAAYIAKKTKWPPIISATFLYAVFISLFFASSMFDQLNLPAAVIKRRADFALLEKGNTDLPMKTLEPGPGSFLINSGQALNHALLRPYPFEFNKGTTIASLELYAYLLVIIVALVKFRSALKNIHPFNIYGLGFSVTLIFIIGLTVPNAGAIIRYRSIIWIFLLCPIICNLFLQRRTTGS